MDYKHFYNIFLSEMPYRVNGGNAFGTQVSMVQEMIKYGDEVIKVHGNVHKIVNGNQSTYWAGDDEASAVSIIVDTEQEGGFVKIVLSSKNPTIGNGSPPYASDLYLIIKNDIGASDLTLSSDSMVSDDAIRLWKGMVTRGRTISVFDRTQNQYLLRDVPSADDLNDFIGDSNSNRYVFVLSESIKYQRGIQHSIAIMEIKKLAGYPLFEHIKSKE